MTTSRRLLIAAAVLWISTALIYVVFEALAAAAVPSYSYPRHYISERHRHLLVLRRSARRPPSTMTSATRPRVL